MKMMWTHAGFIFILDDDPTITACLVPTSRVVATLAGPPTQQYQNLAHWIHSIIIEQCYEPAAVIIFYDHGLLQNILLFHHMRQGEASHVTAQFASHSNWSGSYAHSWWTQRRNFFMVTIYHLQFT